MRKHPFWAFFFALVHLLNSCVINKPLATPYNKSSLSDLHVGDVVSIMLHSGMESENIEKFKIQEIQGDSILVGTQIIVKNSGDTPVKVQRNISISKLTKIQKRVYSTERTIGLVLIIGMIVAVPVTITILE
jgi:hypothetical protein